MKIKLLNRIIMFGLISKILSFCTTFTGGYSKEEGKVYWTGGLGHGSKMETQADPKTFKEISTFFGADARNAYFEGFALEGSDPRTFKPLGGGYSMDKTGAYWQMHRIEGADPSSFRVDEYKEVNGRILHVAKDQNRIYYRNQALSYDPAHFEVVSVIGEICKDAHHVYFGATTLPEADAATFVSLRFQKYTLRYNYYVPYFKDKNQVYYTFSTLLARVSGADPATFSLLSLDNTGSAYGKDHQHIYCNGHLLPGADVASFQVLPEGPADRDNGYYYVAEGNTSWQSPANRVRRNSTLPDDGELAKGFFAKAFGSVEKVERAAYRSAQKYAPQNIALPITKCLPTELAAFQKMGEATTSEALYAQHPEIYCVYIHVKDEYCQLAADANAELIQMFVQILNDPEMKNAFPYNNLIVNYFRVGKHYAAVDQLRIKPAFYGKKTPVTSDMIEVERTHFMEK